MRVTDILGRSKKSGKKLRNRLIVYTLGIITVAIALVVAFTTLTGRAGLVVKKEDFLAGISIKDSLDSDEQPTLLIDPISDAADVYEGFIMLEEKNFLNQDGQYFDPNARPYVAYTFYINNSSEEDRLVNLRVIITQTKFDLHKAMVFKIYVHKPNNEYDIYYISNNGIYIGMVTEENGAKSTEFNKGINLTVPGGEDYLKVTYVTYINPDMSHDDMKNGAVNFEILLEILEGDNID